MHHSLCIFCIFTCVYFIIEISTCAYFITLLTTCANFIIVLTTCAYVADVLELSSVSKAATGGGRRSGLAEWTWKVDGGDDDDGDDDGGVGDTFKWQPFSF